MPKFQQPTAADLPTDDPRNLTFEVNEIFYSIQGEGTRAGLPCVFVRLHGCSLRCKWCDTQYAVDRRLPAEKMTGAEILHAVAQHKVNFVEFTGGEPLEQINVFPLMELFCDLGYTVAVETGGHIDIRLCDPRVIRIVDVKCPSSKMAPLNYYPNLEALRKQDEVKFVIGNREDFEWALEIVAKYQLLERTAAVLFSPVWQWLEPRQLAEWVLETHLPIRLQLQIHKYIWGPDVRGV